MARQRIDIQIDAAAGVLGNISRAMPDLRDHVRAERARIDSWSSGAPEVTVTTSAGPSTTEVAAMQRLQLQVALDAIEAGNRDTLDLVSKTWIGVQKLMGYRAPPADAYCNRKIDPACEQLASPHHDPDHSGIVDGLCDQCWINSCPGCRSRPATAARKVTSGGRMVDGCEACYRRELRHLGVIVEVIDTGQGRLVSAAAEAVTQ